MQSSFPVAMGFTLSPDNDGQPLHVTEGDLGGATAWGVTHTSWSYWLGRPATLDDMTAITPATATLFYQARYWQTAGCDELPAGIDLMVFDHAVVCGEHESAMELQRVARAAPFDGLIGAITDSDVEKYEPVILIGRMSWAQELYYRSCRTFPIFGNGWLARLDRRVTAALQLARAPVLPQP